MLAYAAVCHADLGLRLVVSVSGTRSAGCSRARLPFRFVELHGAADATIPLDPPSRRSDRPRHHAGAGPPGHPHARARRGLHAHRRHGAARTDSGGCRGGGVVRLLVKAGAGHGYAGLGAPAVLTRALEEVGQTAVGRAVSR